MECEPYGTVKSCTARYLLQLATMVTCCQSHIPALPGPLALPTASREDIQNILIQHFTTLSTTFNAFYTEYVLQMKQCLALANYLTPLPHLQHQVTLCNNMHDTLPPADTIIATFKILCCLRDELIKLNSETFTTFCGMLDKFPKRAEAKLNSIMMR